MKHSKLLLFFVFSLLAVNVISAPPTNVINNDSQETKIRDTDSYIDANKLLMFVTNKGSFAYDQGGILGKNDGFYYPYLGVENILNGTATNTVVYAAGVWIGGVDAATGDTLISVAEYSDDYYPGPMSGGTFIPGADNDPQYHVFKLYADSMSGNPNQDYFDWPSSHGAPIDGIGNPLLLGDQTLWSVYNDANTLPHQNDASSAVGMGIEIQHTAWAGSSAKAPDDQSIYSKYELINKSSNTYENFFISLWFDPDIGNAGDDLIGCDTLNNIFFCYNSGSDSDYGFAPPAFGGKFVSGPPMYSFMRYINGTDPNSYRQTYQYMNGLDASQGGIPLANGSRYAVPGDPVTGIGDIDNDPRDVRMMATFGPLDFAPNDTQQIVFKIGVGQGISPLTSITALKEELNYFPVPEAQLITYLSPDPQRVIFMNSIDSFNDSIFVGWSDGSSVTDINGGSLVINTSVTPTSATMLPSHPSHSGPVWKLEVDARQFLSSYGWVYGTVVESYSVSGEFTDSSPLAVNGSFDYIGHRSGDINRNGRIDIVDLTFMINYIFRNGPEPIPLDAGDLNEDGKVNTFDLLGIVNIIFRNG